jgi:HlyD family secretion protein
MRVMAISYLLLGSAAALPATSYLQHVNLQSGWRSVWFGDAAGTQYVTGSVKTDEVVKTVMATGTLAPALNIEVGSVLSGQVSKLLVDFNDKVKKGQVLAELDDKTYVLAADASRAAFDGAKSDVKSHEARLKRATFDLWQAEHQLPVFTARVSAAQTVLDTAEREFKRKQWLQEQQVAAPMDVQNAQSRRDTAAASLQEAQANLANQTGLISAAKADLDRTMADLDSSRAAAARLEALWRSAMVDVDRTKIRSPVDGVVVGRNITEGQTLATGLEAKTLFVIAGDLEHMEINARINESDIAAIRDGQDATFTVDAFPGRSFAAKVKQVRMAPQVLSNVVTYTVVLKTPNPDGILLPGMTVMANIVTQRIPGATTVPLAALRYHPTMVSAKGSGATADSIWVLRDGKPVSVPVTRGEEDGRNVAVSSDSLRSADVVIVGEKDGQSRRAAGNQ